LAKRVPMRPITSVSQLAEIVEKDFSGELHLFRGQPEDKPLIPKIGRGTLKDQFLIEEQRLLNDFRIRSSPYLDAAERDQWDLMAIAQHFGMATRLLDWTANPLAALWFAVKDDAKDVDHGVLWAFPVSNEDIADQTKETPFEGRRTKVFRPRHITKSIVAQSGWFTVHKYMEDKKNFVPFEYNKRYKRQCDKLIVPRANFLNLRHQLDRIGLNHSTMFPDLRGLCDYLNFIHLPQLVVTRFPRLSSL
jgi:hypothetical protein